MHCNEEDKQKYQREPPTTIQDDIKRYILQLYTLQREPNHTGEIIPFNMGRAEHRSKTTPNYFIRTTYKQKELLFSLYRIIIRKQAEPHTTNRIKRTQTANKTLYTSTLHTSIVTT